MDFCTADICDEYKGNSLFVLEPILKSYGGKERCEGEIVTVKLNEDNAALVGLLKEEGDNKIVVVDVEGDKCAVVGDTLMGYAKQNNWAGIIVNGYVRDIVNTKNIPVALFALGTYPLKSKKKAAAYKNIELKFGNVIFNPNDYLYADSDGVILTKKSHSTT